MAAVTVACALLASPDSAHAYRRGLASAVGGATIQEGHVAWLGLGYPSLGAGWGMAVHPVIDLLLHAEVIVGHPGQVDRFAVGGGGALAARFGLVRGRTSLALTVRAGGIAYGEGSGVAALIDIVSPSVDLSFRLSPRVSLHTGIAVPLQYVTEPAQLTGGFMGSAGLSARLTEGLALIASVAAGGTLWTAQGAATARLDVMVGLEYHFGGQGAD